jgi:glycosyltransferase involved in cell wall biosynthesis
MKICVYAISKNEEQFVERFCASAKGADLILIADTGSTDGTAAKARECGAVVHDISIRPWRFDLARNAALALIPGDFDVCISLDLDEVLTEGWREEIEAVWKPDTTNLWYLFDWGNDITFPYRKIHSRHGYHWHHPCHEDIRLDPRVQEVRAWTNKVLVRHFPDPTKSRGQYMDLLEAAVKEDDRDPSHYFYYARELTFYQRWDEGIAALTKYLGMNAASNQNERCYAMRLMAKCHAEKSNAQECEKWLLQAAGEAPNTREPWYELAMLMYRLHRWEECFAFSRRCLNIVDRALVYTCDPTVWSAAPHDLLAISAHWLGFKDLAIEEGRKAVELDPHDPRLAENLKWYEGSV